MIYVTKRLTPDEVEHLWEIALAVYNREEIEEIEPEVLWQDSPILTFTFEHTFIMDEIEI